MVGAGMSVDAGVGWEVGVLSVDAGVAWEVGVFRAGEFVDAGVYLAPAWFETCSIEPRSLSTGEKY